MLQGIEALERRGYYQEQYAKLRVEFADWNHGVWFHPWTLVKGVPCDLCGSSEVAIAVRSQTVCFECLNEVPFVSWHPTGAVRPKVADLLEHAKNCPKHTTPSSVPSKASSPTEPDATP